MSGRLGYNAVKEWFYTLKNVEHVTAMTSLGGMTIYSDNNKEGVRMSTKESIPISSRCSILNLSRENRLPKRNKICLSP